MSPTAKRTPGLSTRRGLPVRFHHIASALRAEISSGQLATGTRIPSRPHLVRRFQSSTHTIQRAVDLLLAEGLLETNGHGTFVTNGRSSALPYLLILPHTHTPRQFLETLALEGDYLRGQHLPITVIRVDESGKYGDAFKRATVIVESHRLAGLILVFLPPQLGPSPVLNEPHVPRVQVGTRSDCAGSFVALGGDTLSLAVADCAARGFRRIAAIHPVQYDDEITSGYARYASVMQAHGLAVNRALWHPVHLDVPLAAGHAARLLMGLPAPVRPDALIIEDDNLVPAATRGIAASGVQVPGHLDVVAHTNFPWPTPSAVPVRRLGYDIRRLLQRCCTLVDCQRQGQPPKDEAVSPAWETDLS